MANDRKNIRGDPDISFIDNIFNFLILQEQMIQDFEERYQELTGKEVTLAAADPLRMIYMRVPWHCIRDINMKTGPGRWAC